MNMEALVALAPDIVITYPEHAEKLAFLQGRAKIVTVPHGRLADLLQSILDIGRVMGADSEARQLVGAMRRKLETIAARVKGRKKIRTLLIAGRNADELKNMYIIGKNDFINDLLEIAGGTNAYQGEVDYPSISLESVIFLDPEFIFEISAHYEGIADEVSLACGAFTAWSPPLPRGRSGSSRIRSGCGRGRGRRRSPRNWRRFFPGRASGERAEMERAMIEVAGLRHCAGERPILQELDFSIKKNDFVLIFGQNGAGKSTLLRILAGMIPAGKGEVLLNGKNVAHYSKRELATLLSYLPQSDEFGLPILVKDILLAGRYPYRSIFKKLSKRDREIFAEGVERFGLGALLARNMQTLSGGERKKVLLATAFIQDVPLILLDEPVNFLDPGSTVQLIKMLENLRDSGKTILLVAHEIERFFSSANKMLALKNGRMSYFGDKKFSRELFREVFQVDFQRTFFDGKEILFVNE